MNVSKTPNTNYKRIAFAAFKGYGDLLCAVPAIVDALAGGSEVYLFIFPQLRDFLDLIDFGDNSRLLHPVILPVSLTLASLRQFSHSAESISPELILISPHAVQAAASRKIPLLLWLAKKRHWPSALLGGAASEPWAGLFNIRLPIDRSLPLAIREWTLYSLAVGRPHARALPARFTASTRRPSPQPAEYDVVIHPGASWRNKQWSTPNLVELIQRLAADLRIAVLGLPAEIATLQKLLSGNQRISFLSGSIAEAVNLIARSRSAITMDSGAMHFATTLAIPTIAIFGPTSPESIVAPLPDLITLHEKRLSCQPCWNPQCSQSDIYCMQLFTPEYIEQRLRQLLVDKPAN